MSTDHRLAAGDTAPAFSLQNADGETVTLADYAGQKVILYFYPAAMTPGCTTQACDFRDNIASLQGAGYQVLGVSKDPTAKLKKFEERDNLNFPLLSDEDLSVHQAYASYGPKNMYGKLLEGTLRSTFVIDEEGKIQEALYNVKATGHVKMLRKKLGIDA